MTRLLQCVARFSGGYAIFVILSAAKNLAYPAASARFFAALRMTEPARKSGRTLPRPSLDYTAIAPYTLFARHLSIFAHLNDMATIFVSGPCPLSLE
ncbi:MAG: hypothetical protein K8R46_11305 [Pirellulales bacterium]|nr:hypothetical protein [Pirellulales bacterium]